MTQKPLDRGPYSLRKILFVIVLTFGLASVLWHAKKRSMPTLTPNEIVSEEVIQKEVNHERHQQLIAPHHTEHLKSEEIKAGGDGPTGQPAR